MVLISTPYYIQVNRNRVCKSFANPVPVPYKCHFIALQSFCKVPISNNQIIFAYIYNTFFNKNKKI